jgi:hypothetical protein
MAQNNELKVKYKRFIWVSNKEKKINVLESADMALQFFQLLTDGSIFDPPKAATSPNCFGI